MTCPDIFSGRVRPKLRSDVSDFGGARLKLFIASLLASHSCTFCSSLIKALKSATQVCLIREQKPGTQKI